MSLSWIMPGSIVFLFYSQAANLKQPFSTAMTCSGLSRHKQTCKRQQTRQCEHLTDLLVLARRLLERVLALGGVYRLGETAAGAAAAGERLDREDDLCRDTCWVPPAEVGYAPLLEAVTSILAVAGRSPIATDSIGICRLCMLGKGYQHMQADCVCHEANLSLHVAVVTAVDVKGTVSQKQAFMPAGMVE